MKKLVSAAGRRLPSFHPSPPAFRVAALVFFVLLMLVGSIPGKAEAVSAMVYDKLLHFVAYSLLSALIYGAIDAAPRMRAALTLYGVGLLGALDEGLQALLPYRNGSWLDWQVDMAAAAITVIVLFTLQVVPERNSSSRRKP